MFIMLTYLHITEFIKLLEIIWLALTQFTNLFIFRTDKTCYEIYLTSSLSESSTSRLHPEFRSVVAPRSCLLSSRQHTVACSEHFQGCCIPADSLREKEEG